jgi:hypothetical protein
MRGVFQLRQAGGQHLGDVAELRLQVFLARSARAPATGARRAAFVAVQQLRARLGRVEQRLRVRQARVAGVELVPLVGAGRELVDLADLPGQPLAFALQRVLRGAASASVFCAARQRCHSCCSCACRRRHSHRAGRAPSRAA